MELPLSRLVKPKAAAQEEAAKHYRRGVTQFEAGNLEGAVDEYQAAIKQDRTNPEVFSNLGHALRELGRIKDAVRVYRKALRLHPRFAALHYNLAIALDRDEKREEAEQSYRKVLSLQPGLAESNLAALLMKRNRKTEAVGFFRRSVEFHPNDPVRRRDLGDAIAQIVSEWHFPMMNDGVRNDAYLKAITSAVTPETYVLEIGTGSGLLAMMAARAGASHVTTCEVVDIVADAAQEVIQLNGFSDKITVLNKNSRDLVVGVDMPDRADLLISEILSSEFVGEGVIPSLQHAHAELLSDDAPSIPRGGAVMGCLVGGARLGWDARVEDVAGFDLRPFNKLHPSVLSKDLELMDFESMSDGEVVIRFDYPFESEAQRSSVVRFQVIADGRCHGVAQWIHLDLDDTVTFSNDPHAASRDRSSGWHHIVYVFDEPVQVSKGQTVELDFINYGRKLAIDTPRIIA